MPIDNAPLQELGVWDKLSLYTLFRLMIDTDDCDGVGIGAWWFCIAEIKEKVTRLLDNEAISDVDSDPKTVSAVTFCLERFAELGIVACTPDRLTYRIVRSTLNDALYNAIASEAITHGDLDADYTSRRVNAAYINILCQHQLFNGKITDLDTAYQQRVEQALGNTNL